MIDMQVSWSEGNARVVGVVGQTRSHAEQKKSE